MRIQGFNYHLGKSACADLGPAAVPFDEWRHLWVLRCFCLWKMIVFGKTIRTFSCQATITLNEPCSLSHSHVNSVWQDLMTVPLCQGRSAGNCQVRGLSARRLNSMSFSNFFCCWLKRTFWRGPRPGGSDGNWNWWVYSSLLAHSRPCVTVSVVVCWLWTQVSSFVTHTCCIHVWCCFFQNSISINSNLTLTITIYIL